jgi:uncharacterized membrane protein
LEPYVIDLIKLWTTQAAVVIEAIGALIITLAAVEAAGRSGALLIRRQLSAGASEAVRLRLGTWLVLAIEFELAADILRTAIAPSWNDLGMLAAIIGLRTVLNYILQLDLARSRGRASVPEQNGYQ